MSAEEIVGARRGAWRDDMREHSSPACYLAEFEAKAFTIRDAVAAGARRIPGETPRLEAEVLLAHILGRPRAWLMSHPEVPLAIDEHAEFAFAVDRLADGEPLAYIIGHREFFGLDFLVSPNVLVPRPETELLVEHTIRNPQSAIRNPLIADIGTGAGCIAVSLAVHLPHASIIAADISEDALAVARANAERHGVADRIEFRQGDLLEAIDDPVDLLCANLPYIDSTELAGLAVVRHEPRLALDGGAGGLTLIGRLLSDAPRCVNPGGLILLEIGSTQAEAATALSRTVFPNATIRIHKDLAALDRLIAIHLPNL